ncbi:hypothetical protein C4J95_2477 [Pseudomonas orientalis]|nr:hypothetical protein C4J95_2477 [Pseudomonas orientalis]
MGDSKSQHGLKHRPVSPGSQPGGPMHDLFWRMGDGRVEGLVEIKCGSARALARPRWRRHGWHLCC